MFVFRRDQPAGGGATDFYMAFDSLYDQVTATPAPAYAKWAVLGGDACQRPYVTLEDVDHDGQRELVVREVTHNGSSYNACVRHYYRFAPDLSLQPMLAVEERSLQDVRGPETWLVRRLEYVSAHHMAISVLLRVVGSPDRKVGEVTITDLEVGPYRTSDWKILSSRVLDARYRQALITDSGEDDNTFLIEGRTLWY